MQLGKNNLLQMKNLKTIFMVSILFGFMGLPANAMAQPNANTPRPLPGYWEFSTRAAAIYSTQDQYCLSQAEIDKFYQNPCNRSNTCVYSTKVFKPDGSVSLVGTWTDKKKRSSKVKGNGTFGADRMKLNLHVTLSFGLPVSGVFEAKRIAATCSK